VRRTLALACLAVLAATSSSEAGRSRRGPKQPANAPAPKPAPPPEIELDIAPEPASVAAVAVSTERTSTIADAPVSVARAATPGVPTEVSGGLTPTVALSKGASQLAFFGTFSPTFDVAHRDRAAERDRWAYGAASSRAALGIHAGLGDVSGIVYVRVAAPSEGQASVDLERAVVRYKPIDALVLAAGRDRVPLTLQSALPSAAMLFPSRIALNSRFAITAQAGAQVKLEVARANVQLGAWNGASDDITLTSMPDERGLLYTARAELTPLGSFELDENGGEGDLRIGIGGGASYRAATRYLADGESTSRSRDLRAAAALRIGWRGLLVTSEVMRRQVTDDLSMRPDVATGAYLQASYRVHAGKLRIVPMARVGALAIRELAAPATGSSVELGGAVFPMATDKLRLSALYQRVVDPDLGLAQGALLQIRLAF